MSDVAPWLAAVRRSHERLAALTAGLSPAELGAPSACSDWTIAQVLSHLGSQAEIFSLVVDAGISGGEAPSSEAFGPIWDAWNARTPEEQAADSTRANEALVSRLDGLDRADLDGFHLEAFGRALDAAGLLRMRLSEHAVHTWDIAVVGDPAAEVDGRAVELLLDGLGETAARSGVAPPEPIEVAVVTSAPGRQFDLHAGPDGVSLEPGDTVARGGISVELPAEALVRLVYGRLDEHHPARGPLHARGVDLTDLTGMFPGY